MYVELRDVPCWQERLASIPGRERMNDVATLDLLQSSMVDAAAALKAKKTRFEVGW